ncbi:OmpA family protein [Desulfobacterales bacterium HSG2]|nr:OmpA family protein [Desulfobacterales bacterium HSG2]
MAKNCFRVLLFIMISIMLVSCSGKEPQQQRFDDPTSGGSGAYVSGSAARVSGSASSPRVSQSPESFRLDAENPDMGEYMRVQVNDFVVILDASGSKYLPYSGKIKLRIAKDIVRRLNQNTPERPLFGGLRRYGFEAGAWSKPTALLYGMTDYSRPDFASAIEIVRWAGGKSPMALSIDKASDDFQLAKGHYLSLVIVSDGKIYQGDPIEAAKRIKQRYGDRICIYTALVGNLPFGRDLMERVAKEGKCGYAITADDLEPSPRMRDWADDIFHHGRKAEPEPEPEKPIPGPRRAEEPPPVIIPAEPDPCELLDEALRLKVQFDLNKWDIKPEYYSDLNRIAHLMMKCAHAEVEIVGHTCNIWTEKYNMKLSHLRATEVMKYLVGKGIRPGRLRVSGVGLTTPTAPNKTEAGRVANRRAEFRRIR